MGNAYLFTPRELTVSTHSKRTHYSKFHRLEENNLSEVSAMIVRGKPTPPVHKERPDTQSPPTETHCEEEQ